MSGRWHARHVRLFRSKHYLLPEHGWFDDGSNGSEHRVYADAWFSLSAWWVDWLLPICGSLDRLHCDYNINGVVHSACCYRSEHWDYSDTWFILFGRWRLWFVSVCRWDNYVCCNVICYDTNNCLCVYNHANNCLCVYNHHIHIAANVSCSDSVYVD